VSRYFLNLARLSRCRLETTRSASKLNTRIHPILRDSETPVLAPLAWNRCVRARKANRYNSAGGSWAVAVAEYAELWGVELNKGFDAEVGGVVHEGEVADCGGVGHVGAAVNGGKIWFLGTRKSS
jgi:hypothetical protein